MITTIAFSEFKRRIYSAGFWLLLCVLFVLLGLLFLSLLENFINTVQPANLHLEKPVTVSDGVILPYFWWAGILVPALMPLLAMSAPSNAGAHSPEALLRLAPFSPVVRVLGKSLSLVFLATIIVACVAVPALLLGTHATLDIGQLISGLIGLWLFTLSAAAVGLYFSTLLRDPLAAALASYAFLLLLALLYLLANFRGISGSSTHLLASYTHFQPWLEGRFDSLHLGYFLILGFVCMVLAIRHAAYEDLRGH